MVLNGLTLTAPEHVEMPNSSDDGYLGLWIAHHLLLRLARAFGVVFGLAWCGVSAASCGGTLRSPNWFRVPIQGIASFP
jgi:hypothetical protein